MDSPAQPSVCPWWKIRTFDNPLRRLVQKPERILRALVRDGDRCLDLGCGYGYFTIWMATLAGPEGSVTAADLQQEMLAGTRRRARKAGLEARIHLHLVDSSGLPFRGEFDCALAFWMIHEVPDQAKVLGQLLDALKPGGRFLLVEPKGHVTGQAFRQTLALAEKAGFMTTDEPRIFASRAVLMAKRGS
jgi:ubiquinone/menaquinone biosynthesis C-methylase UbiE